MCSFNCKLLNVIVAVPTIFNNIVISVLMFWCLVYKCIIPIFQKSTELSILNIFKFVIFSEGTEIVYSQSPKYSCSDTSRMHLEGLSERVDSDRPIEDMEG